MSYFNKAKAGSVITRKLQPDFTYFYEIVTLPTQCDEVFDVVGASLGPLDQVMDGQVFGAQAEGVSAPPTVTPKDCDSKPGEGFPL